MAISTQSINQVQSLFQESPLSREIMANQPAGTDAPGFGEVMKKVLDHVNSLQADAGNRMEAVETGQSTDLLGAMIASQKASLSFQSLLQVRNKVVSAYEEVMRMQV
ncbi:flagellar hook-basal body complex protein FliE [Parendozoicomonas haliclonae]|uniref:Flagellar hook-basal body complex protein FliE n=1 Tax=Parendozoicomonas haliclonae TaxID=1960125 RepID=A0A1X7AH47_9GAMM|nr:flagellar hook-basal body complex protein FliE [Parendozoicomonas haliclonae]SMA39682.1 Flagellar hook-basal body complex protein FliE [Parendozoicomonas haliclonae]